MKYKRSFIFIRQDSSTDFYSDTTDFVSQLRAVIPDHVKITSGRQGANVEYVSFWYPEFSDYEWFTQNLYISGDLKLVFRNAMVYAKTNRLAFCLPSINLQNTPAASITRSWYYNIKSPEEKLYDATPGQKQALNMLTKIMSWPDSVHSVTIFDFDHNLKFTEQAVTGNVSAFDLNCRMLRMERSVFKDYSSTKQEFNKEHNIKSYMHTDHIGRISSRFDLEAIKDLVPIAMQDLVLDLEL
jgi:hypothetical protein